MSISLSVFITEPLNIEVAIFSAHANDIFNFLLGGHCEKLSITFQNSAGLNIERIDPNTDELYRYIETNIMHSGGYISYAYDEHWKYHSDKETYEFCITEINFNPDNALFAIQLSMLIAVAQHSKSQFINDAHGVFFETNDDKININDILDFSPSRKPDNTECPLRLLYNKLKISRSIFTVRSQWPE